LFWLYNWEKRFTDAGRSEEELEGILMYILGATVIGARLGHVFFYEPGYYLSNPLENTYDLERWFS